MRPIADPAELQRLIEALRTGRVVPLAAVQRAGEAARGMREDHGSRRLLAKLNALVFLEMQEEGEELLDVIEAVIASHKGARLRQLACLAARHDDFRLHSRSLRRWAWTIMELPTVSVQAHTRQGRPVRAHGRVVGFAHLAGIVTSGRDPLVGEVLRIIVAAKHLGSDRAGISAP